jgi:sugar lactone lactonase YvrE
MTIALRRRRRDHVDNIFADHTSGERIGIIRLPEYPANCAWGGPDQQTMFFTANTSVYRWRMKTPGTPIPRAARASG